MNLTLRRGLDLPTCPIPWPKTSNGFKDKVYGLTILVIRFQQHILREKLTCWKLIEVTAEKTSWDSVTHCIGGAVPYSVQVRTVGSNRFWLMTQFGPLTYFVTLSLRVLLCKMGIVVKLYLNLQGSSFRGLVDSPKVSCQAALAESPETLVKHTNTLVLPSGCLNQNCQGEGQGFELSTNASGDSELPQCLDTTLEAAWWTLMKVFGDLKNWKGYL